jgi:hypothetical protein
MITLKLSLIIKRYNIKENNLIKYGYEYPMQNLSIKNKVKYKELPQ